MSQLDVERIAVERLDEGVTNLAGVREWQRTREAFQKVPFDRLSLTRKVDQARARGDLSVIDDLLAEIAQLDQYVTSLEARNLQLEKERGIDGLTGVANRARLDTALRHEWRRCGRMNDTVAVIFVDLDEFKAVNDGHGHRAGDALLVGVGQQLQRVMRRAGDFVGRFGGDEFLIVLPATSVEEAAGIAQRLHEALGQMQVQYGKIVLRASASIGVAAAYPYNAEASIEGLLDAADKALYAAKQFGRNRIVASVEHDGARAFAHVESIAAEEEEVQVRASARAARR